MRALALACTDVHATDRCALTAAVCKSRFRGSSVVSAGLSTETESYCETDEDAGELREFAVKREERKEKHNRADLDRWKD